MGGAGLVAVIDVGKTTAKVVVADPASGAVRWMTTRPVPPSRPEPYRHIDVQSVGAFVLDALASAPERAAIRTVVPVAHGACAALLVGDELALPVLDYEEEEVEKIADRYRPERDPFSETLSPDLPLGLNLGRQFAYQEARFPEVFARVDRILLYPQYWAWSLTGVAAAEVTSLGAHTDLWRPRARDWSELARRRGWTARFPRIRCASAPLGPIRRDIARQTGLSPDATVLCGIHDSNASFLRHLDRRRPDECFSVVSTGTWIIAMAQGAPLDGLNEQRDMLANVNVHGAPVPTARFMGGREYEAIVGHEALPAEPTTADLSRALSAGAMALPTFAAAGPFQGWSGRLVNASNLEPAALASLATLYLALVTDHMLALLRTTGDVVIEGPLAANPLFGPLLASLRPEDRILRSGDRAGTLGGALVIAGSGGGEAPAELCQPLSEPSLAEHRHRWVQEITGVRA